MLSSLPLYDHLTDEGVIAVWVTNKPVFRDLVLEPGGLFEVWGVELAEEWIWVKTTVAGEPVQALDSAWRRPYEILLVGRRDKATDRKKEVKRRVFIAVPDLHSRKPSPKAMFEAVLQKQANCGESGLVSGLKEGYDALEIFARNLTAGWWSWGCEVLKFQDEKFWVDEKEASMQLRE